MCENSSDSNDANFLDDSFCTLFDEGDNTSVVEIDLNKDIVNSNVVDEIESNLDELDSIDVRIENMYMPFADSIWEDFMKSNYKRVGDDFSKYFQFPIFLIIQVSFVDLYIFLVF